MVLFHVMKQRIPQRPKMNKHLQIPKRRNFVAKNMLESGGGRHAEKAGSKASRTRQKREWKKEINDLTP